MATTLARRYSIVVTAGSSANGGWNLDLHRQRHVPGEPGPPRRSAPGQRLRLAGRIRDRLRRRGARPGQRPGALPRRHQRLLLRLLRRRGVPGRAADWPPGGLDKDVTVYRAACVLHFSGARFLDFLQGDQWLVSELVPVIDTASGSVNASDAWFSAAVTAIFTALVDRAAAAAAASNSTRKYFATAEMDFQPKIYGLVQCAPDLTPAQCQGCLGQLFRVVELRYLGSRPLWNWYSAFVLWCSLRYSVSPFYEGRAMLQLAAPPAPSPEATLMPPIPESRAGMKSRAAGIYAAISCSVVFMLILSVYFFIRMRRRINKAKNGHRE